MFVPAAPGTWTLAPLDLRSATHESAHAVTAVRLGIPVREVRIDRPDVGLGGLCLTRADVSREGLRRQLAAVVAPWVFERRPLPWPPEVGGHDDEQAATILVGVLDLDEAGWWRAHDLTRQVLDLPSTRRAITAVAGELLDRGALPGERVRALTRPPGSAESRSAEPVLRARGDGPTAAVDHRPVRAVAPALMPAAPSLPSSSPPSTRGGAAPTS